MPIWTIAKYEIIRKLRTRYVLLIQFLMPLLLIFILGSALSGVFKVEDKALNPVKVDIVQVDSGALREGFQSFLDSPETKKHLLTQVISTREEAIRRLKDGESEFAVIIPINFTTQVQAGKAAQWEMVLGHDYMKNLTAQMVFRTYFDKVNQNQAIQITARTSSLGPLKQVEGNSSQSASANPSLVHVGQLAGSNSSYTAMQYYAASILVMFLLYSGMITAFSLQNEKANHTLSRLNGMPIPEYQILLGKIIGNMFLSIGQVAVIIGATKLFYGVDWGSQFLTLFLICLCMILASMSLAIVVMLLFPSDSAITVTFQTGIMIMTFLSGGFTPLPDGFLKQLGSYTLNYWGMQSVFQLMLGSETTIVAHHLSILGSIAIGLSLIAFLAYRKGGYHE
ncbi:ABC transporter permease [Paenibacillus qinlingensis]|uniref:ABC transporter permease n=1 Tax=Paenibacillus qinlingensis TaxID=1837343 RepID=UPI001566FBFB|nr:ABC transporter permease [Paenibacillus qinlingensis]NQX57573.1 ABC transporter permease [Paenibacillus qinlingensis]